MADAPAPPAAPPGPLRPPAAASGRPPAPAPGHPVVHDRGKLQLEHHSVLATDVGHRPRLRLPQAPDQWRITLRAEVRLLGRHPQRCWPVCLRRDRRRDDPVPSPEPARPGRGGAVSVRRRRPRRPEGATRLPCDAVAPRHRPRARAPPPGSAHGPGRRRPRTRRRGGAPGAARPSRARRTTRDTDAESSCTRPGTAVGPCHPYGYSDHPPRPADNALVAADTPAGHAH